MEFEIARIVLVTLITWPITFMHNIWFHSTSTLVYLILSLTFSIASPRQELVYHCLGATERKQIAAGVFQIFQMRKLLYKIFYSRKYKFYVSANHLSVGTF